MSEDHFTVEQLTVFVENKPGRSAKIFNILAQGGVDLISSCIADTNDFGLIRLIASEPDKAKKILKENNISARSTEILVVSLPDKVGGLAHVLNAVGESNINISYMYAFVSRKPGEVVVGLKVDNLEESLKKLKDANLRLMTLDDLL